MKLQLNHPVSRVFCHNAVLFLDGKGFAKTERTVDAEKHFVKLELVPAGVLIISPFRVTLIGSNNYASVDLLPVKE